MLVFEIVIALLLGGALLSMVSRRIGAPYPAVVALAGAALALMPGTPSLSLDPRGDMNDVMQRRYSVLLARAETESADLAGEVRQQQTEADATVIAVATSAERQKLLALRADGTIGDAAFQRVEQELDFEEVSLQAMGNA